MKIENFDNAKEALRRFTESLMVCMDHKKDEPFFNLALSGGETAKKMFELWREEYTTIVDWKKIRFFWVDERCVPPSSPMSNYGEAQRLFFQPMHIMPDHIFPIEGDIDPGTEAMRYSRLVSELLPLHRNIPYFDCIVLGIGHDAHTASIFSDNMSILTDSRSYAATVNPSTKQWRITMTGHVILNDSPLLIPILGAEKSSLVELLQEGYKPHNATPAAYILSHAIDATLFVAV